MRRFLVFSFLFFYIFCMRVHADDTLYVYPDIGYRIGNTYSMYVYPSSSTDFDRNRIFCVAGSQLKSAGKVILSGTGKYGLYNLACYSSEVRIPLSSYAHQSAQYTVDIKPYVVRSFASFGSISGETYEFVPAALGNIDDNLYYYFVVQSGTVGHTADLMQLVPKYVPTPTPTRTPASTRTPAPATPLPVPTLPPTAPPSLPPVPTRDPVALADTLDGYKFWSFIYDTYVEYVESGGTSARSTTLRFVPSAMANFSDDNVVHNYVYTVPVRIPVRISTDFTGVGLVDVNYSFDMDYGIFGVDGYGLSGSGGAPISSLVDLSNPWIESADGVSYNATVSDRYGVGCDVFNLPLNAGTSGQFYFCYDMYISLTTTNQVSGLADYVDVMLDNIQFELIGSVKVSDALPGDILGDIRDEIKDQNDIDNDRYEQEQDKISEAEGSITDGAGQLTGVLSSWEIFTMPFKLLQDFVAAISGDGTTGFTFPAFELLGQQLWPSYTFDLQVIAQKFPVLYNMLHLISGIGIVSWFVHYCWRKWHIFMGDDLPEA